MLCWGGDVVCVNENSFKDGRVCVDEHRSGLSNLPSDLGVI